MKPRRIAIMIGSDSDLPQCLAGLEYLAKQVQKGTVEVVEVITSSLHRNTDFVLEKLRSSIGKIDVFIVGAGWANALTGANDAYLRNTLRDKKIVVIGVAFEDEDSLEHTETAIKSILHVPGNQVVFDGISGPKSFSNACWTAAETILPEIKLKDPKPTQERTLSEAIIAAKEKIAEKKS